MNNVEIIGAPHHAVQHDQVIGDRVLAFRIEAERRFAGSSKNR